MRTGQNGRVAILWSQTELDGLEGAPLSFMTVGAAWSWRGHVAQVCDQTYGGPSLAGHFVSDQDLNGDALGVVILTNGAQQFSALLYGAESNIGPVLVFENAWPSREQEFWIDEVVEIRSANGFDKSAAETVIAFPTRPSMAPDIHAVPRLPAANAGPAID